MDTEHPGDRWCDCGKWSVHSQDHPLSLHTMARFAFTTTTTFSFAHSGVSMLLAVALSMTCMLLHSALGSVTKGRNRSLSHHFSLAHWHMRYPPIRSWKDCYLLARITQFTMFTLVDAGRVQHLKWGAEMWNSASFCYHIRVEPSAGSQTAMAFIVHHI